MNIENIGGYMSGIAGLVIAFVEVLKYMETKKKSPGKHKDWWTPKKPHFWLTALSVILVLAAVGILIISNSGDETLSIKITAPEDGSSIPLEFTVEGYTNNKIPLEQHLYVVIEYGGLWWPQYSEISIGYSHMTKHYMFSTPSRVGKIDDIDKIFGLRAILVDSLVHQHFQNWLKQNSEGGEWLGISITEMNQKGNVQIYDSISITRK